MLASVDLVDIYIFIIYMQDRRRDSRGSAFLFKTARSFSIEVYVKIFSKKRYLLSLVGWSNGIAIPLIQYLFLNSTWIKIKSPFWLATLLSVLFQPTSVVVSFPGSVYPCMSWESQKKYTIGPLFPVLCYFNVAKLRRLRIPSQPFSNSLIFIA